LDVFDFAWWRWVWEAMLVMVVLKGERAVVSTLAGGLSIGTNGAYIDASGTSAGFRNPVGVAVDVSGNVFVADQYNQRIRKVTAGGGTRIGPVTLRASVAVQSWTWQHRRELVGRFSHIRSPSSHYTIILLSRGSQF
jgi:hypothetical protein